MTHFARFQSRLSAQEFELGSMWPRQDVGGPGMRHPNPWLLVRTLLQALMTAAAVLRDCALMVAMVMWRPPYARLLSGLTASSRSKSSRAWAYRRRMAEVGATK